MDFLSFGRNLSNKYGKKVLDAATKTGLYASKKVVHKAAETTGEFIRNKITDTTVKPRSMSDVNSRDVEKLVIPPEIREEIQNELRQVL